MISSFCGCQCCVTERLNLASGSEQQTSVASAIPNSPPVQSWNLTADALGYVFEAPVSVNAGSYFLGFNDAAALEASGAYLWIEDSAGTSISQGDISTSVPFLVEITTTGTYYITVTNAPSDHPLTIGSYTADVPETNFEALLYHVGGEANPLSWNGQNIPIGGQVFVTYVFNDDPSKGSYAADPSDPEDVGATRAGFVALDESFQDMVRFVLAETEKIAGINFIEIDPDTSQSTPMLEFHGSSDTTFGGFANYPDSSSINGANITIKVTAEDKPEDLISVTVHELGHALGLRHPFDEDGIYPSIKGSLYDHQFFTIMSYTPYSGFSREFRELDLLALDFLYGQPGQSGLQFATEGDDLAILGTSAPDSITGSWLQDIIIGSDGDDSIDGQQANDVIFGGSGADNLFGGLGSDTLYSDSGNSKLRGEGGDDLLFAHNGNVVMEGGDGADLIITGLGSSTVTGAYSVDDSFDDSLRDVIIAPLHSPGNEASVEIRNFSVFDTGGFERDAINVAPFGIGSWAELMAQASEISGDVVIRSTYTSDFVVTIKDMFLSWLTEDNFIFEQANDAPIVVIGDIYPLAKNSTSGTIVADFDAFDPNFGDTLQFSLDRDAGGLFDIDPATGIVTLAREPDVLNGRFRPIEVVATDQSGLGTSSLFSIPVIDTNDAPIITPGVIEATITEGSDHLSANGSLTFSDADQADTHRVHFALTSAVWSDGEGNPLDDLRLHRQEMPGAGFELRRNSANDSDVDWNYTIEERAINFLAAGETVVLTFAVTVDDNQGGTATQDVLVTITGTNEAAVITAESVTTGAVTEDDAEKATASGNLDHTDVDGTDDAWQAVEDASDYGTFTIDAAGAWSYTLNDESDALHALAADATLEDIFTAMTEDGTTQDVTITITGTNDAAVIGDGPTDSQITLSSLSILINQTDQNLSQFKGLTAAYSLLGGVPSIDGYRFLINRNNETNFGAGGTAVFNDENIYINTVNALYQGNGAARANFDAIVSTKEMPNDKLSLIYDHIIPEDARSDDGRAHFLSQADFYTARAAELGIEGENGAAVVASAALTKIAVDSGIDGFGGSIIGLIAAVNSGTASIPESGSDLTPIGTAIGGIPVGPVSLTSGTDDTGTAGDGIDFASLNLLRVDDSNTHWGIDGPNTLVAEELADGSDVSNWVYSSMQEVPELGATGETDTAILSVISDDDGPNFVHGIGPEVEDMAWTYFI